MSRLEEIEKRIAVYREVLFYGKDELVMDLEALIDVAKAAAEVMKHKFISSASIAAWNDLKAALAKLEGGEIQKLSPAEISPDELPAIDLYDNEWEK